MQVTCRWSPVHVSWPCQCMAPTGEAISLPPDDSGANSSSPALYLPYAMSSQYDGECRTDHGSVVAESSCLGTKKTTCKDAASRQVVMSFKHGVTHAKQEGTLRISDEVILHVHQTLMIMCPHQSEQTCAAQVWLIHVLPYRSLRTRCWTNEVVWVLAFWHHALASSVQRVLPALVALY